MRDVKTSPKFEWADQWILASTRKLERLIAFLNNWLLQSPSKVSGSRRLLIFTFFLFFSLLPTPLPQLKVKYHKTGGGELKGEISTTVYKGEYLHDGKLETEEK